MASTSPLDDLEKAKKLRTGSLDIIQVQIDVLSDAGHIEPDENTRLMGELATLRTLAPLYEELSYALKNGTLFRKRNMPDNVRDLEIQEQSELTKLLKNATTGLKVLRASQMFSGKDTRREDIGVSLKTIKEILKNPTDVMAYDTRLRNASAPATGALANTLTTKEAQDSYRQAEATVRSARAGAPGEFQKALAEYKSTLEGLVLKAPSLAMS